MPGITFTTSGALRKSALRQANGRLILDAIRMSPGISRADLARLTGLSPSSVTYVVGRLKREGWIAEARNENHRQIGRKPTGLQLRVDSRLAVGVEISLSNPHMVLADLSGRILGRRRIQWHPNPPILLNRVRSAINVLLKSVEPDKLLGIGVSVPGNVIPGTGRLVAAENLGWRDVEIGQTLEHGFSLPFYYENDANLSALAEKWFADQPDQPLENFVSVMLREGVGTGVIVNGHSLHGSAWTAGEFGHTMLYADGRRCSCGNRGCWEQYASETALRRSYREQSGLPDGDGEDIGASEILEKARAGDAVALSALREAASHVGLGLVNLIWALNPEAIVLGGYIADSWDLTKDTIWDVVRSRIAPYNRAGLRIRPSQLKADASILGAVALVFAKFFTSFNHEEADPVPSSVSIHASV